MGYLVKSNISHNGIEYSVGQVVNDIDEEAARVLVADGVLEVNDNQAATTEPAQDEPVQPTNEEPSAEPEAPANDIPLDDQPVQPDALLENSEEVSPSIDQQVRDNIAADLAASKALAETPGKPVQPTASDIEKDINDI